MSETDRQRWDSKYAALPDEQSEPSRLLEQTADLLPAQGRALDVAGGDGRNAIWLAQQGLDVTLADISPVGLRRAEQRAARLGLKLSPLQVDFDTDPLPAGPWDLIVSMLFYCPRHLEQFAAVLAPGGMLVYVQPTRRNLLRHDRPPERFLLPEGALPGMVKGLDVVRYEEGWLADGRHDAFLVARRPSSGDTE